MIWNDVWEDLDPDYYVHPLHTSPASYRPVWHAVQGSMNTPTDLFAVEVAESRGDSA